MTSSTTASTIIAISPGFDTIPDYYSWQVRRTFNKTPFVPNLERGFLLAGLNFGSMKAEDAEDARSVDSMELDDGFPAAGRGRTSDFQEEEVEEVEEVEARNDVICSKSVKYTFSLNKSVSSLKLTSTPLIPINSTVGWAGKRQCRSDQSELCQCHSASAAHTNSRRLGVHSASSVHMGVGVSSGDEERDEEDG